MTDEDRPGPEIPRFTEKRILKCSKPGCDNDATHYADARGVEPVFLCGGCAGRGGDLSDGVMVALSVPVPKHQALDVVNRMNRFVSELKRDGFTVLGLSPTSVGPISQEYKDLIGGQDG